MRPGDGMIREELRREAEAVPIPADMWQRISAELDRDLQRQHRRRRVRRWLQAVRPLLTVTLLGSVIGAVLWACPVAPSQEALFPGYGMRTPFLRPPHDNLRAGYISAAAAWQVAAGAEAEPGSPLTRMAP